MSSSAHPVSRTSTLGCVSKRMLSAEAEARITRSARPDVSAACGFAGHGMVWAPAISTMTNVSSTLIRAYFILRNSLIFHGKGPIVPPTYGAHFPRQPCRCSGDRCKRSLACLSPVHRLRRTSSGNPASTVKNHHDGVGTGHSFCLVATRAVDVMGSDDRTKRGRTVQPQARKIAWLVGDVGYPA